MEHAQVEDQHGHDKYIEQYPEEQLAQ